MSDIQTDPTPPEVLGAQTGAGPMLLADWDAYQTACDITTSLLKRLSDDARQD